MNELITKLTNLSYEIFGVFLPGVVATVFMLLVWIAIGPLAPYWTNDYVPLFNVQALRAMIDSLSVASGVGAGVPLLIVWYFVGHIVLWIGRSGKPMANVHAAPFHKVMGYSLIFRIPKPTEPFNPSLRPLFDKVTQEFSSSGISLDWRQFYPAAKVYLSRKLTTSLVSTYQNKYTFHRSVVTIAAVLFWCVVMLASTAYVTIRNGGPAPSWKGLFMLGVGSLAMAKYFCSSYLYHWEMFGNTIITETFSLLCGPKDSKEAKDNATSK